MTHTRLETHFGSSFLFLSSFLGGMSSDASTYVHQHTCTGSNEHSGREASIIAHNVPQAEGQRSMHSPDGQLKHCQAPSQITQTTANGSCLISVEKTDVHL
jgi:hypothetical protein